MSAHIAFLTPMAQAIQTEIARLLPAGFSIAFAQSNDRDEHVRLLLDAQYVFAAGTWIDAELILNAPKLKMIQKWGIGVDKIDLAAARKKNITVAITSGASSGPVAEHAIMLMLAVYRRLPMAHRSLAEGQWLAPTLRPLCFQLARKTVGLLGFGNIAQHVARRLQGFDVNVIYHSRTRANPELEQGLYAQYVDFETLITQSDVLSLHIPASAATHHLINAQVLGNMKSTAILINTARGEVVDESALIEALRQHKLGGAGLDTFEGEPPAAGNPLLHMDQVVVTPHSAGAVMDNVGNIVGHAFNNIQRFESGLPLDKDDLIA